MNFKNGRLSNAIIIDTHKLKIKSDVNTDEFSKKITEINKEIPGRIDSLGITEALGYEILDAKLDQVEIVGSNRVKILEASTAKYIAEENACANLILAENNLKISKLEAEGTKAKLDVQSGYLKDLSEVPGAMEVEKRKATPNLTTLVENGKKTNLLINK